MMIEDIKTFKDLWKNPEWKELSKEFTKDKNCAWCGKYEGDKYKDGKGRNRKIRLSPHHIEKHKWGLALYKQIQNRLFKIWWKDAPDNVYDIPTGLSSREKRKFVKFKWISDNKGLIKEEFEKEKRRIIKIYIDLNEDEVIVFCNRCHYARENGLVLCFICKKNYHKIRYSTCFNCKKMR